MKAALGANGQLQRQRCQAKFAFELLNHVRRVSAAAIHLVDERQPGHSIALHLAVDGDRLRLDAGHGAQDQHRTVQNPQRALDFDREVDVSGRIDNVDLLSRPLNRGGRRGDGDASLALELHVVHHGAFALNFLDDVGAPRVIQDAFGQGGFARIDMG